MVRENGPVCVSVINMKGGVGKTTIAALLSLYASRRDNVLAIDLDPQANLSQAFMREDYKRFLNDGLPSVVEVFKGYRPPTSTRPSPRPLDVESVLFKPTPITMASHHLDVIPSRFDFSDNLIDSIKPDPRVLAKLIADHFQEKDLIIIDCAPTESIFTQAAYHASRYVLVPVKPEYFATIGFPLLNESLSKFKKDNPSHQIDVIGVVINNSSYSGGNDGGPEKQRAMDEIREEAEKNQWRVFDQQIPFSRGFPKIMRGDWNYSGKALEEFPHFAREFFQALGIPFSEGDGL